MHLLFKDNFKIERFMEVQKENMKVKEEIVLILYSTKKEFMTITSSIQQIWTYILLLTKNDKNFLYNLYVRVKGVSQKCI